ncbi:MAG TPA: hypothetical protein VKV19_06185 [Ktedonobacteraceae bacterium]|jgi:hypothetical protein|nr:hypothetical protein [Ktedonobacteraceae bacterium]
MSSMIVEYILFFLAAFILVGAVMALNKRLSRHDQSGPGGRNRWVKLDVRKAGAREEPTNILEDEDEDEEEAELHARASQNGHRAESQKPQI